MSVREQAIVFAAMAAGGYAMGLLYDVLSAARRMLGGGRVITAALDLVYGPCCALGVIALALFLRTEAFRLYVLLGASLGMAAYAGTMGMFVRIVCRSVRKGVKKREKLAEKLEENAGKWKKSANV